MSQSSDLPENAESAEVTADELAVEETPAEVTPDGENTTEATAQVEAGDDTNDEEKKPPKPKREYTPEEQAAYEKRKAEKERRRHLNRVGDEIATALSEKERKPRSQVRRITQLMGEEWSRALLEEVQQIEENGGMMISSGDRRRTPGGVYFFLARDRMPEELAMQVFYTWRNKDSNYMKRESKYPELSWDTRGDLNETQIYDDEKRGEVLELQITMTGRPGELERRQELVVFTMEDEIKDTLQLPRGVPHPGQVNMVYTVFASVRQWERIEKSVKKNDDPVIVNGYTAFDEETNSMVVFATQLTTKRLKKQDKQGGGDKADKGGKKANAEKGEKPAKKEKAPKADAPKGRSIAKEIPETAPQIEYELPPGVPPDVAQKLTELYRAATTFQQKIEVLASKPANEQFGLEMTQKLLKNTQTAIDRLEKPYRKGE